MPLIELRSRAWYGDTRLPLRFPPGWDVTVHWPDTPPAVSDDQLLHALDHPIGQQPIAHLARGCSRPVVIVDDLTRPTPAGRVLPFILRQFDQAGIPADRVTVLMATGTHGPPVAGGFQRKAGPDASAHCRLLAHDDRARTVHVGTTSAGTPIDVNPEVIEGDLVIGIAGIYPQNSTGFGGGSKLALGVLGRRSITALHYGHESMRGSYETDNDFRRDLDEIAAAIKLNTVVSMHVDVNREVVRVVSGDHRRYYADAVEFSKRRFSAPLPGGADVVVSNAYPIDTSLTFMRSKGIIPLLHAAPASSRVLISACPEGVGHHGLFPLMGGRLYRGRHILRRLRHGSPADLPARFRRKLMKAVRRRLGAGEARPSVDGQGPMRPIRLYAPEAPPFPPGIPGMELTRDWDEAIRHIESEQAGRSSLRVAVYPCAPLQVLDIPRKRAVEPAYGELAAVD